MQVDQCPLDCKEEGILPRHAEAESVLSGWRCCQNFRSIVVTRTIHELSTAQKHDIRNGVIQGGCPADTVSRTFGTDDADETCSLAWLTGVHLQVKVIETPLLSGFFAEVHRYITSFDHIKPTFSKRMTSMIYMNLRMQRIFLAAL